MKLTRHIPNAITSMNLLSGIMGVIFTMEGHLTWAFPLMLAGAVFDFADGLAARLLGAYSPIGKELDSLADMVTFGVLPSLMLVETMRLEGITGWAAFLPVFLAIMSALRLAKFNVDERQGSDFLGVATPTSAMICGSLAYLVAVRSDSVLAGLCGTVWFLPVLALVLGLLLVSEIPMFGMKIKKGHSLLDKKRVVFLALAVLAVLATVLLGQNWSLAVLLTFSLYVLENLILRIFNSSRGEA